MADQDLQPHRADPGQTGQSLLGLGRGGPRVRHFQVAGRQALSQCQRHVRRRRVRVHLHRQVVQPVRR